MNALCEPYREHLALYAEGEIAEPALRAAISIHLVQCAECRDWIEDYEEFTRDVVELLDASSPEHSDGRWAGPAPLDLRGEASGEGLDRFEADRVERILLACLTDRPARNRGAVARAVVRRHPRRRFVLRRLGGLAAAAALLVAAALHLARPPAPPDARLSAPAEPSSRESVALPSSGRSGATAAMASAVSAARSGGAPGEERQVDLLRWFFDDELDARRALASGTSLTHAVSNARTLDADASGEIELLGHVLSYSEDPRGRWTETTSSRGAPRWRLRARREFFRDPDGGGWVFLVPADPTGAPDGVAIPLRRIDLRPAAASFERGRERQPGERVTYRLVVVPDAPTISERLSPPAAWTVRSEKTRELRGRSFPYRVDPLFVSGFPAMASVREQY